MSKNIAHDLIVMMDEEGGGQLIDRNERRKGKFTFTSTRIRVDRKRQRRDDDLEIEMARQEKEYWIYAN